MRREIVKPRVKIALWVGMILLVLLFLRRNLYYFSSPVYLEGLILLEIVLASLARMFDIVHIGPSLPAARSEAHEPAE